ncbi:MAG: PhnD/SsuA/transferrin family substrate-binding protein [Pseudomonadota bacterium]
MSFAAHSPVASLPMYDHPAVRQATDRLWRAFVKALRDADVRAPDILNRQPDYASLWLAPGLIFSQTCGYPYMAQLRGKVQLVATPVYKAMGCEGPYYCSIIVVRRDDHATALAECRGRIAGYNAAHSQSGYNSLRAAVAPLAADGRFFSSTVETGSHSASMDAVAAGTVDLCAVDCVTWALMVAHEPVRAAQFKIIQQTPSAPGLPFITSIHTPPETLEKLRAALTTVCTDPALASARDKVLLDGAALLGDDEYQRVLELEQRAIAQGYPVLN